MWPDSDLLNSTVEFKTLNIGNYYCFAIWTKESIKIVKEKESISGTPVTKQ